jgi:sugar phosphate isomerase/epimerase
MNRRRFARTLACAGTITASGIPLYGHEASNQGYSSSGNRIRLGGPVFKDEYDSPERWLQVIKQRGYSAAICPVEDSADDRLVEAYRELAAKNDIIIAEVGAWSNPIHPDKVEREAAVEKCIRKLGLAERIGARCCVNVSGSRGTEKIGGPHAKNLTEETFQMIVETTRGIIDAIKPSRTFYTLEMMPCSYPDSVDSYLELIRAIDRKEFAVHLDPVNLMNSPSRYYHNGDLIRDAFKRLGKYIRSCHAKDTLLRNTLTLHIDEIIPGQGNLDYQTYLQELGKLNNVPLMMEHMGRDEYPVAAEYIRKTGKSIGLNF